MSTDFMKRLLCLVQISTRAWRGTQSNSQGYRFYQMKRINTGSSVLMGHFAVPVTVRTDNLVCLLNELHDYSKLKHAIQTVSGYFTTPSCKQQVVNCSPQYRVFSRQRNREGNLLWVGRTSRGKRVGPFRLSACSQIKTD
jgi:hypothetical protein